MGMRHIKNTSSQRITVPLSVMKSDGSQLNVELAYGESILVTDTGSATKSVIIQVKKGNITMNEEFPEEMVPYQVCVLEDVTKESINETYVESETYEPVIEDVSQEYNTDFHKYLAESEGKEAEAMTEFYADKKAQEAIVQAPVAQIEEITQKKAGRPKGSTKKKRGRPKGSTKKKKLKKLKALGNEQQKDTEQTGEQSQ